MNGFSSFITAFCGSCIIIGLLFILSPEKYKKILRLIFGIVFLLCVISGFAKIKSVSFPSIDNPDISSSKIEMDKTLARLVYETALKNEGLNFKEIEVCTDKLDSDSIIITKVIIRTNEEKHKIIKALGSVAENYEVEIINE